MTVKYPGVESHVTDSGTTTRHGEQFRVWRVTLSHRGRTFTFHFHMAPGHDRTPPTTDDVLGCLLDDYHTYDQAEGYVDWCHHLGMSPEQRDSELAHTAVRKQAERLQRLLGDDTLQTFLYGDDR